MNPEFVDRFISDLQPAFEAGDSQAVSKTLESENVSRIREMYECIRNGDYQAFSDALADDAELELVGAAESPITGHWRGREEVLAGSARNYGRLEDQRPVVVAVIAQGDQVAVVGREAGLIRATGHEYETPWLHLFTFRDGKVTRIYGFSDSHALIQASMPAGK